MESDLIRDYDFELPEELIAQSPAEQRDQARLLVVRRNPEVGLPRFEDLLVSDLPDLVRSTPLLKQSLWVRNRSRVFAARFYARRPTGSRHEIVLLEEIEKDVWKALVRGHSSFRYPQVLKTRNPSIGSDDVKVSGNNLEVEINSPSPGIIDMRSIAQSGVSVMDWLDRVAEMPLPPYIKHRDQLRDRQRYQSLWADPSKTLSVAAPTASLHFSQNLMDSLEREGVNFADLYLHVGLGTFEPFRGEKLSEHRLHEERLEVSAREIRKLKDAKSLGAIGTTALRALESLSLHGEMARAEATLAINPDGRDADVRGRTSLFVKPGFEFRYARFLWTNFHLPRSSLLVLVSTFCQSRSLALEAYQHAIARRYRFFSYGDASLWL